MSLERDHPELFHTPKRESGACGTGFVAALDGIPRREISDAALTALDRLEHRGGTVKVQEKEGTFSDVSDGAGVLLTIDKESVEPHLDADKHLEDGEPALAGVLFVPKKVNGGAPSLSDHRRIVEEQISRAGLVPLGWRLVPTHDEVLGRDARETAPHVVQFFCGRGHLNKQDELDKALWALEQELSGIFEDAVHPGDSSTSLVSLGPYVVYKGLATSPQLRRFYTDLKSPPKARVALFHRRYATNTHTTWDNTQPVGEMGENGENNAVAANRNEVGLLERRFDMQERRLSIVRPGASDSRDYATFVRYLRRQQGMSLPRAMRVTTFPAVWERSDFTPQVREWLMRERHNLGPLSAWGEGPKLAVATDGKLACAVMDRMGYRPAFWFRSTCGIVGISSEPGAVPFDAAELEITGRLRGGDIAVADTDLHDFLLPPEIHERLMIEESSNGSRATAPKIFDLGAVLQHCENPSVLHPRILSQFGWTADEMKYLDNWLKGKIEPRGAMGRDRAPPALSRIRPPLTKFGRQVFASCTNPADDPELEGGACDTSMYLGSPDETGYALDSSVLTPLALYRIETNRNPGSPKSVSIDCLLEIGEGDSEKSFVQGAFDIADRIEQIKAAAIEAVQKDGASIIILTHRNVDGDKRLPLETFLVASAVNEALIEHGLDADIVVETPSIRDRHDMMVNFLCGVSAICPVTIFERGRQLGVSCEDIAHKLREAVVKGLALPGVTSMSGGRGSKLVEFVGLGPELMRYMPGFVSKIGGIGLAEVYEDMMFRRKEGMDARALPDPQEARKLPKALTKLEGPIQLLAITGDYKYYQEIERILAEQGPVQLWDLLEISPAGPSIPVEDVISEEEILQQCIAIAHMSFGALSDPAHRAIARFANKHGITSGSGEGGERPERRTGGALESDMSRDREIASGRFGVNIEYLADPGVCVITLKIHQGAKPNEGADVPPGKNTRLVAQARGVTPGTRLRSPVTMLDLFSIEDFAQLVLLMREANPSARIVIKIASNTGNDMIARGLIKSGADEIDISGGEGGTGSASLQAIDHTGHEKELGLADAHRAVIADGFEEQTAIGVDGGMLVADDVLRGLAMGARWVKFGGLTMQALGCLMLRSCNITDGCKPGIATQNENLVGQLLTLGKRATVTKETPVEERLDDGVHRLENVFLRGLCHRIRERCAELGVHSPLELLGRTDLLKQKKTGNFRFDKLDLGYLTERAGTPGDFSNRVRRKVERIETTALNRKIMVDVEQALARGEKEIELRYDGVHNFDQAIGTRLSGERVRNPDKYGVAQITLRVSGTPGHGCFFALHQGMKGVLEGFSGDMFGASMMDGTTVVAKPTDGERAEHVGNGRIGNVALYGARGGEAYIRGGCGERFCARLSGTRVVQEGPVGKYFCHFMSGGRVLHLSGEIGDSPFCGMTGGKVYVLGERDFEKKVTHNSVQFRRELHADEEAEIHRMLVRYVEETGSPLASTILAQFDLFKSQFTVVEPDSEQASSVVGVKHKVGHYYVADGADAAAE